MQIIAGSVIRNFRIIRSIGSGGMGEVWLAEEELLGRKVAIKVLNPALTRDEHFRQRFLHEARVQSGLLHPNIVALHTFFELEGAYYMVLEYAGGVTLRELIARTGPLPEARVRRIMAQLLGALRYAHGKGVVHRDVKPANIMVDEGDEVKVMDFGIARLMGGDSRLTGTGVKLGTLYYMSPEQILTPAQVDHRTDIYSAGLVLYEMLSGKLPFSTDTQSDYVIQREIVDNQLPHPQTFYPSASGELSSLAFRMTDKETDKRPSLDASLDILAGKGQAALQEQTEGPDAPPPEKQFQSPPPRKKGFAWGWVLLLFAGLLFLGSASFYVIESGGFGCTRSEDTSYYSERDEEEEDVEPEPEKQPAKPVEVVVPAVPDTEASPVQNTYNYYGQWLDDYSTAVAVARQYSRPILFHWSASTWCPWCVKLSEEVIDTDTFYSYVNSRYILLRYDNPESGSPDQSDYYTLQQRYGVTGFPTVLILDSYGNLRSSIDGYKSGGPESYIQNYLPY